MLLPPFRIWFASFFNITVSLLNYVDTTLVYYLKQNVSNNRCLMQSSCSGPSPFVDDDSFIQVPWHATTVMLPKHINSKWYYCDFYTEIYFMDFLARHIFWRLPPIPWEPASSATILLLFPICFLERRLGPYQSCSFIPLSLSGVVWGPYHYIVWTV